MYYKLNDCSLTLSFLCFSYMNGAAHEIPSIEATNLEHNMVPLQRSKSIPIEAAASSGSSCHSSTEEETYKGESSTTEDEKVQVSLLVSSICRSNILNFRF